MTLNDILATTATQFIDIALGFVGIMIVYYIYRLFTVGNAPRDDSELHGRQEAAGRWVRERRERAEHQAGAERRRRLLEPARGFLIRAEQNCDHIRDDLEGHSAAALRSARNHIDTLRDNLRSTRRVFRAARAHSREDSGSRTAPTIHRHDFMEQMAAYVETIDQLIHSAAISALPTDHTDPHWDARITTVRDVINQARTRIGYVIRSIDQFIETDAREVPSAFHPGGSPYGPAPHS